MVADYNIVGTEMSPEESRFEQRLESLRLS
jgi:hypothetical protein